MNTIKTSLLALSIVAAVPMDSYAVETPDFKNLSKLLVLAITGSGLLVYYFRKPVPNPVTAPLERFFEGECDNLVDDIFNWDNIVNFSGIFPGQKEKSGSTTIDARGDETVKIKREETIPGRGVIHFCVKNIKSIITCSAAMTLLYQLLYNSAQFDMHEIISYILDAQGQAKNLVAPKKA